ncbi:MAG: pitrilysin family protein [Acidobacteria bacterium]|nr:pitrilysin family protein [Acidobacteriota bacterium]
MRTLALGLLLAATTFAQSAGKIEIKIPYQKFVLKNGLTLLVHEDRKTPIVAVNVWYHVGSKNEKPGRTGFAHLFEHLMFNGSENFNQDYFQAMERIGATDLNGTTSFDRTNYFQNAPTPALDQLLFLESDRMGHLLGVVDQARLDEQRGVVMNEKRQGENQPYALAEDLILKSVFPPGHPYSWSPIGSEADLKAASLPDVKEWFKRYYGAANAVIAIAGDVDAATAKEKVEKYFGWIPPGPPVGRMQAWVPQRTNTIREIAVDRVPQARLYKVWAVPGYGSRDGEMLDLAAAILAGGKTSRLYRRLVYQDQIATTVTAENERLEIAGMFSITATVKPGGSVAAVEKAVDEELARFLKDGPTAAELARAKTQGLAGFLRGVERIGGFGGKSDVLATCEVYTGNAGCYEDAIRWTNEATADEVKSEANAFLAKGAYILEIQPTATFKESSKDVDRKELPKPGPTPALRMPALQRATLSNGLKLILAERHETPVVNFNLQLDAGYAADQGGLAGASGVAMRMVLEGTKRRTSLQISDESANLGANLSAGSNLDMSSVSLSALKMNLDASLDLFADVVLNPVFPEADFKRVQAQQIAAIQREKVQPVALAQRVLPGLLYGKGHAYGNPLTGSGTEESVKQMTRASLEKFHATWVKPNNATLLVVGDSTMAEIQPKLEKLFAGWKSGGVPKKNLATVAPLDKTTIYLIDKPGAVQSMILAGHLAPPRANPNEAAIDVMNTILGGAFTSRLNMNLREDKHWAYGAQTMVLGARGQRTFMAYAPVQSDKTKESLQEIDKELRAIIKDRPVTDEEVTKSKLNLTLSLAGERETKGAVLGDIADINRYGLAEDYFTTYAQRVNVLERKDISAAAEIVLRPTRMVYVVVGDRAQVEKGLKELGFGEVKLMDADGNVLP